MKRIGIVGWKNSGKTTLVERLVAIFTMRGVAVSTVKHAHHTLDVDTPGRDSHRHRMAGAREVMVSGGQRWALMHELRGAPEPSVDELIARLTPVDLVIVEGFKQADHMKIEAFRTETGQKPIALSDPSVIAVAADGAVPGVTTPILALDEPERVADFIARAVGLAVPAEG